MPRVIDSPDKFIVLGENIHATRVVKRGGVRGHVFDDGAEAIKYRVDGVRHYVHVPEHFTKTQPYEQGMLKHFMIAMLKGIGDDPVQSLTPDKLARLIEDIGSIWKLRSRFL